MSVDSVLRGIIMLSILKEHGDEHVTQVALCKKEGDAWVGLLHDQWDRFKLKDQGFHYPCSGAPHVANAATLMGQMGFMQPPGSREAKNERYALTPLGDCLAALLLKDGVLRPRSSGVITEEIYARAWVAVTQSVELAFKHTEDIVYDELDKQHILRDNNGYVVETTEWLFLRYAEAFNWVGGLKENK